MTDDKGNVVTLPLTVERKRRLRDAMRGKGFAIERVVGPLHPRYYELQERIDEVLHRIDIYEAAGRPDEAARLRKVLGEVLDRLYFHRTQPPWEKEWEERHEARTRIVRALRHRTSNRAGSLLPRSLADDCPAPLSWCHVTPWSNRTGA